jgi:ribose-phosphate pyrophosphokinase
MIDLGRPILFNTLSYGALRKRMEPLADFEHGTIIRNLVRDAPPEEHRTFKDGEHYMRLDNDVEDRECIVVGGGIDHDETLDLFDLGNVLFDSGAARIKFVVPFYPYSTMERAVKPREAVRAKYRARLFSAIPNAPFGNKFYFLDLHSHGIPHYLENRQHEHIYAKPIVMRVAQELANEYGRQLVLGSGLLELDSLSADATDFPGSVIPIMLGNRPFVFASTDAGRMKWIESLAKDMGVRPAFAYKHREGEKTESLGISGDVKGMVVVIFDDMIRSGSSLMTCAPAYLNAGARALFVISTHGVLPGDSLVNLRKSGLFQKIVVTDSHPRVETLRSQFPDFLQVESVASLLVENVHKQRRDS